METASLQQQTGGEIALRRRSNRIWSRSKTQKENYKKEKECDKEKSQLKPKGHQKQQQQQKCRIESFTTKTPQKRSYL